MPSENGEELEMDSFDENQLTNSDLIRSKAKKRRRVWIISGIIGVVGVGLAIAAIVLLTRGNGSDEEPDVPDNNNKTDPSLTLEDFLTGNFSPRNFNGTWTSENEIVYTDSEGNLVLLDVQSNSRKVLLESSDPLLITAFDFQLSPDGLYLLVAYNYQKLYRHSFRAEYFIVTLSTGEKTALKLEDSSSPLLQVVQWSTVGNALAFVFENNIYFRSNATNETSVQITNTEGFISNGIPDWVYEEEVLSSNKAIWFSPDGKRLAYARFNDTEVPLVVIPIYGEPGSMTFQYPRANVIKYPKAGTTNPTVTLHYVEIRVPERERVLGWTTNLGDQPILTSFVWLSNVLAVSIWLNRVQNRAEFVSFNTALNPDPTVITRSITSEDGWLELFAPPVFSATGTQIAFLLSQDQGDNAGSFRQIVTMPVTVGSSPTPLTKGKFVVSEILSWDHSDNLIYYLANTENSSSVQHLYSVSPSNGTVNCLSCGLKSKNNASVSCSYNTAEFSKDSSYYVLTCAGPDVPSTSIYAKGGEEVMTWSRNENLVALTTRKTTPTVQKLSFEIANGFTANVILRLPPNIDTSGETKYPMLINVYGGPDNYQDVDKFTLDWGSYLAANKSIIYAAIDGRGSGLRGDKLLFANYRNLGTYEIIDQINVTRLIQSRLPYVDSTRTGIWGWSYGGYASALALATDTEGVFKCGISVAPVTDWTLYDSIYTERFMGLPTSDDNEAGYKKAQLFDKFKGLENKEYFLIHGSYDDNVHYQQSMLWAKVLERNDILFRQLSYPDEDHSLASVRPHLYHSLENFLDDCFVTGN